MEALVKNHIAPIKVCNKYTFEKGKNKSFLNIMSVLCNLVKLYKKTKISHISSDHFYVTHEFYNKTTNRNREHFKYSTKDIDPIILNINSVKLKITS